MRPTAAESAHLAPLITLSKDHLARMIDHALADAPIECCGLIAGNIRTASRIVPMRNAEASPYRFSMEGPQQRRALDEIDERGEELLGFYHSHTGSEARPSPTDIRSMSPLFGPPYVHFVIGLEDPAKPVVRVFTIEGTDFEEGEFNATPGRRKYEADTLRIGNRTLVWGARTYVMGIINVTPDSFSGDGVGSDPTAAAELAVRMEAEGADLIDVGAESSRPEAEPLPPGQELKRLLPALRAIREATSLPISVDTCHSEVAAAAIDAGAEMVNDISGLRGDRRMAGVIASARVPAILMHNQRGRPFGGVIADILQGLGESARMSRKGAIDPGRVILDPGFGFGWTAGANLEMLQRLPELWRLRMPLLVGTSRKSTIGKVLDLPIGERLDGTAATVALAIAGGADIVRVHDVAAMVRVARMSDAIVRETWPQP